MRQQRHWTQAELARHLGLSQARFSEIERGGGSFTAEQFLAILKLFNIGASHFASSGDHESELDVVDVVVSKLKRLSSDDLVDIEAMCERGVTHEAIVDVFRQAVDFTMDAKADDLPKYRSNFHRVERDLFGIDEPTEIELPSWVCDD